MDGTQLVSSRIVRRVISRSTDARKSAADILSGVADADLAALVVFCTPGTDCGTLSRLLSEALPGVSVFGCTTAGEIGPGGYCEGTVVGVGLPRSHFCVETVLLENVSSISTPALSERTLQAMHGLARQEVDWEHEFAFLLVDGLSMKEDQLAAALVRVLQNTQLFGGSAGDGLAFEETRVFCDGAVHSNAAILSLIRTRCPFTVFRFDNFQPTDVRMVVTDAEPEKRLVKEINAEPAAKEYARLVGKRTDQLSPRTFAAHPVVVRVGGRHHVRAISQVEETGHLRFLSAIDEGLVLTVATGHDLVSHLKRSLDELSMPRPPDTILACDCILRRLDAQSQGNAQEVSALLDDHGVVGFSTYGEQVNGIHVNQTFVGIALYPPDDTVV